MLIRFGYEIGLQCRVSTVVHAALRVHATRVGDLCLGDAVRTEPHVPQSTHEDEFGNRIVRFVLPPGPATIWSDGVIQDAGLPDEVATTAPVVPVAELADEVLPFLRASRYCNVEELSDFAWQEFGPLPDGWSKVQAVCNWVHQNVAFGYGFASPLKTALDVYQQRTGVCRDFAHLAITLCRALNIPARYAAGYLPDIGVAEDPAPMDFCAWFEASLGGRWYTFDARHNIPRIGRVLMARGRDAADAAMLTTFGDNTLTRFQVHALEYRDVEVQASAAAR